MFRWLLATGIAAATYLIFARNQDDNDDDLYEQIIEQHVSHAKSKTTYHLYACGSNQYGELGIASVRAYKETFTLVKLPENLQDIHLQSNIFGGYMYLQAKYVHATFSYHYKDSLVRNIYSALAMIHMAKYVCHFTFFTIL